MAVKYIFVTGGVVSGLGKGITAASLGRLLKQRGLRVKVQKLDPYLNVDPGTMSPYQHGEVFVTDDGAETDLDLGHYERFVDESLNKHSSVSAGKVYWSVLNRELEGAAARIEDVSPRNALFLSRGTADQLYLSVRLAVCGLCLPEKPPILLDDALAAFDDRRMVLALELLKELAREQQVLLFTCQRREGAALEGTSAVTRLEL